MRRTYTPSHVSITISEWHDDQRRLLLGKACKYRVRALTNSVGRVLWVQLRCKANSPFGEDCEAHLHVSHTSANLQHLICRHVIIDIKDAPGRIHYIFGAKRQLNSSNICRDQFISRRKNVSFFWCSQGAVWLLLKWHCDVMISLTGFRGLGVQVTFSRI